MPKLNRRLLETIYPPNQYANYVYRLADDTDKGKESVKHAIEWCKENATELEEIYNNATTEDRMHPFNKDELGNNIELTLTEWGLVKYFIWEYNTIAENITDYMFENIDDEINDLINGNY